MSSPSEVPPFRLPPGGVPILRKPVPPDLSKREERHAPAAPKNVSPDAQYLGDQIHQGMVVLFGQLKQLNSTVATIAEPAQLAHVPCLAPLVTPAGERAGWGVFCYACSFGGEENEYRYCQLDEIDLSDWPPQRVVAAPEFVEEGS